MRLKYLTPLLLVVSLASCQQSNFVLEDKVFCFDTVVEYKLYEGEENNKTEINELLTYYDKISDNYKQIAGLNNLVNINSTSEDITLDEDLYNMLKSSFSMKDKGAYYFNPLCGSLAKKWKESLAKKELLSEEVINKELAKINTSSLIFKENNVVQRVGEAELDLGAFAKGYVLDEMYNYLSKNNITHYLINGGSSSILLGEKKEDEGYYKVGIDSRILANSYLKLKNCFVSTSSVSIQGVKIDPDGPTYSHIVNPINGSVINKWDAVIVVSSFGALGDALSTSMMMNELDEIKTIEKEQSVKCVVIKDKKVTYHHPDIEVYNR